MIGIRVSGSQAYLMIIDDEMVIFGYNGGPVLLFDLYNDLMLTFVSSEQITEGGEQGQGGEQEVVVNYTFYDDGGNDHALAVIEGKEATIDGKFHFTYNNGHYYFDDDDTCYFEIRHAGADLFDYYGENMAYYLNGIAEFYADEGTADLTVVD